MPTTLKIIRPDDMHLHLRQGVMLKNVLPHTARVFGRALIMPNTLPPVVTALDVVKYRKIIATTTQNISFTPLMTFKITAKSTPAMIYELKNVGAIAGKLYPQGVTTNSADGIDDIKNVYPVLAAMEKLGLVLCVHGELPDAFSLDREEAFLPTLKVLTKKFPRLKIVLEHITTAKAVALVTKLPKNVVATITAHHLFLTIDDVIGDALSPHNFCKPVAKRPEDRYALIKAATNGNPKFFFGSDSAPHLTKSKESSVGAAGIFTAPLAISLLAKLFDECDALSKLESFVSIFGANFYGLPINKKTITLVKKPWTVPNNYNGVVPFMAGNKLNWQIA